MKAIHVGLGGRAGSWIQILQKHPEIESVAYVEPVEASRAAAAQKFNLPADRLFVSLQDALKATTADFVLDITPPAAHETIATAAFAAGLHVLEEKPMSDDFAACRRIVRAAHKAGRTYMITQNYRFGAVPRTTRRLIETGVVGKPEIADMGFYWAWASRQGTHYTTMPFPLIKDMGIHHFDLLRYVLAREPKIVHCKSWRPSWAWHAGDDAHNILIEFDGGLMATHHANGCSVGHRTPWNGDLRIEGAEGSITWENDHIFVTRAKPGQQPPIQRHEEPLDRLPHGPQEACLVEFVSALQENREPECSGRDNLQSLAIVFAAVESAQKGRPVEIEKLFKAGRREWERAGH